MECRNQREYKQEREEFTVTVDNACTIHSTKQSHVLRKCVEDEEHFTKVRSIVEGRSLLCCSDLSYCPEGSRIYVFSDWHHIEKA